MSTHEITTRDLAVLIVRSHHRTMAAIRRLADQLGAVMTDQEHLDADVTALSTVLGDIEAEVATLKAAAAAQQPLDFTKLDGLVASAQGADPGPATPSTPPAPPAPAPVDTPPVDPSTVPPSQTPDGNVAAPADPSAPAAPVADTTAAPVDAPPPADAAPASGDTTPPATS